MKAVAFSPAHVTGFFEICYGEDEKSTGSRGAGICLSLGSYAEVERMGGDGISIEGNVGEGDVTMEAMKELGINGVKIRIRNQLPLSQGFGMSASSTLASSLAACHLFSLPPEKALEVTHVAEVRMKGGLGDAISSFGGGMEIRKKPGLYGTVERKECTKKVVVAVLGESIKTHEILKNERMVEKINEAGREAMKLFLKNPSIENLFHISYEFSLSAGLANEKISRILREANKIGRAAMCMLGNSIFAIHSKEMLKFLSRYEHYECFIDNEGARVLASFLP